LSDSEDEDDRRNIVNNKPQDTESKNNKTAQKNTPVNANKGSVISESKSTPMEVDEEMEEDENQPEYNPTFEDERDKPSNRHEQDEEPHGEEHEREEEYEEISQD
jgi:hypothetical protein